MNFAALLRHLLPCAIFCGLAQTSLPAQTSAAAAPASANAPALFVISGTVVNAVSGEPIRRGLVAVLAEQDSHAIESVLSDNDGRFVLADLPAAKYQLTASKRGFRSAFYDEHDEFSTAIVTGSDQDTSGLRFRLMPGGVIRGVVTADGGDPVESAQVMLFRKPRGHMSGDHIERADGANSDDTGAFEFSNLPAGDYFVAVTAEPWYAIHRPQGANGAQPPSDTAAALDVAYPATYFDSTTDEASATPITLAAGATEEARISLHAVPALHIAVQTQRRPGGGIARPELRQSIFGVQVSAESMGLFDAMRTGSVEFTGIAPGNYELVQGNPPRVVELDANSSQQVDPGAGVFMVDVAGTLKFADGAALPPAVTVVLEPLDNEHRRESITATAARGAFHFQSVPPGRYAITVQGSGTRLSVLGVSAGARSRAGNTIAVADKPLQIAVTIAQSGMRVAGFARKERKGFAGAMVVLVPQELSAVDELARRDQSDSDGSFLLRDVAPGQYTIVAIRDGWELDWSNPEVIRRFLPSGTPVKVTDGPEKQTSVAAAIEVQSP